MTTGLRIRNAYGSTQIDERYSGLGCSSWGTITMTSDPAPRPNPMRIGQVTVAGTNPLIALSSAFPVNVEHIRNNNNGTWTFFLRCQGFSGSHNVSYWIFDNADRIPPPAAGEKGLVVRNPTTGAVVFHNKMKPLRLVETINITRPANGWNGSSAEYNHIDYRTVPGGRAYAVIQGAACFRFESYAGGELVAVIPDPGNEVVDHRSMHSASVVNGNQIEAGLFTYEAYQNQRAISDPDTGRTDGNLSFWVVDVTGYGGAIPSADYTPNAVNWAPISLSTTSNYQITNHPGQNITGIDVPITLKATVSGYSGNLTNGTIRMLNYNGGSPIVLASRSWTGAGSIEGTVSNGQHIYFDLDASTASGIRSGSATVTVQNMADQGVVIDTFTISATVDSDNNYNMAADKTPNPVNWNDVYQPATGEGTNIALSNTQTISGLSSGVPITLRVTGSSLYASASAYEQFATAQGGFSMYVMVNGSPLSAEMGYYSSGFGGGDPTGTNPFEFNVQNGDTIQFVASNDASSNMGGASGSGGGTFTVTNASDGHATLDTFRFDLTSYSSGF